MNFNKLLLGVSFVGVGLIGTGVAVAQDTPSPSTPKVSVGISIDSRDGLTNSYIDCKGDGEFATVNGDGTLFMENRTPHTMRCTITIRRIGTLS